LAALLLGQSVLGQPDATLPPIPMPTFFVSQPESPPAKSDGAKAAPETTTGQFRAISQTESGNQTDGQPVQFPPQPRSPDSPGSFPAPTAPILQAGVQVFAPVPPPSSPTPLAPKATANKQISGTISVDVQPGRQQPALSIEWGGPTSIRINQPMSCQIVVRNTSTTPAQNVVVRHRLGQSVTCKTSEPAAVHDNDELVWNLGTLAPQQARRIDLSLVSQTRGALNCHATVTFSAVAAYQVQVREPQLAVKMRGPDKVIAGENVTFVFAISNPGDGVAEAVKLKTTLPDGLEQQRGKLAEGSSQRGTGLSLERQRHAQVRRRRQWRRRPGLRRFGPVRNLGAEDRYHDERPEAALSRSPCHLRAESNEPRQCAGEQCRSAGTDPGRLQVPPGQ
jgi:uncharacterized repeat protein (TIGR01451 family)